jgi:hypothetical protein
MFGNPPVIPSYTKLLIIIQYRSDDRKKQKEKRNNARLQGDATYKLHATWHPFFCFRDATQTLISKNSEEANGGNPNTEGAVAKSASRDSPFTHGRLD